MKKLAAAGGVLAVLLGGLAAYAAMQPASFRIQRNRTIAAAPEAIFPLVATLKSWPRWSPWAELDLNQQNSYGGPAEGVGQTNEWNGNDEVGHGRMTVLESHPPDLLVLRLEFIEPFAAVNETRFELAKEGAGTRVAWTMTGNHDFMGKLASLFMNMDEMVGKDFEKGLAKLETVAVAAGTKPAAEAPAPVVPAVPTGG